MRPTANDADANADRLTLRSVEGRSHLGGTVVRNGEDVTYTAPPGTAPGAVDWFTYVVADATGRTATGVVLTRTDRSPTRR